MKDTVLAYLKLRFGKDFRPIAIQDLQNNIHLFPIRDIDYDHLLALQDTSFDKRIVSIRIPPDRFYPNRNQLDTPILEFLKSLPNLKHFSANLKISDTGTLQNVIYSISELKSLESLALISVYPASFDDLQNLTQLKYLYIFSDELRRSNSPIPDFVGYLEGLRYIEMAKNPSSLYPLPEWFLTLPYLEFVRMGDVSRKNFTKKKPIDLIPDASSLDLAYLRNKFKAIQLQHDIIGDFEKETKKIRTSSNGDCENVINLHNYWSYCFSPENYSLYASL